MKQIYIFITLICGNCYIAYAQNRGSHEAIKLSLADAIELARLQSVDAAVALNKLKTAYWEYRTHVADQLPEVNLSGVVPAYSRSYSKYQRKMEPIHT